jgi:hypothetical protein
MHVCLVKYTNCDFTQWGASAASKQSVPSEKEVRGNERESTVRTVVREGTCML